jgi:hypothetical protein
VPRAKQQLFRPVEDSSVVTDTPERAPQKQGGGAGRDDQPVTQMTDQQRRELMDNDQQDTANDDANKQKGQEEEEAGPLSRELKVLLTRLKIPHGNHPLDTTKPRKTRTPAATTTSTMTLRSTTAAAPETGTRGEKEKRSASTKGPRVKEGARKSMLPTRATSAGRTEKKSSSEDLEGRRKRQKIQLSETNRALKDQEKMRQRETLRSNQREKEAEQTIELDSSFDRENVAEEADKVAQQMTRRSKHTEGGAGGAGR